MQQIQSQICMHIESNTFSLPKLNLNLCGRYLKRLLFKLNIPADIHSLNELFKIFIMVQYVKCAYKYNEIEECNICYKYV